MRNPERIPIILERIRIVWEQNPDLRLCQLIGNCFPAGDNYAREDDLLEKKLEGIMATREEAEVSLPSKMTEYHVNKLRRLNPPKLAVEDSSTYEYQTKSNTNL